MSSAIGDILANPAIQKTEEPSTENEGILSKIGNFLSRSPVDMAIGNDNLNRGFNAFNKGVAYLPDAISNLTSKALGLSDTIPKDPIESLMRSVGSIKDYPEAETIGQKLAEGTGSAIGSSVLPGGVAAAGERAGSAGVALGKHLLGLNKPLEAATELANPTAISTLGSVVAPVAAKPAIEEYTDNPIARSALELGSSFGGALAAGKLATKIPEALPLTTAAQRAEPGSVEAKDLAARQLDVVKSDPKAADLLENITSGQESRIADNLESTSNISGTKIKQDILDAVKKLKDEKNTAYETGRNEIIDKYNDVPIDLTGTNLLINKMEKSAAAGTPLEAALSKASTIIERNKGDLDHLINAKSAIQDMTENSSGLNLGSKQSVMLQKIARQLNKDIDQSVPGYAETNQNYYDSSKKLENIIEGAAGKTATGAEKHPSEVFRQIFEKTDPELSSQIKEVLPEQTYNQAADAYLSDVVKRGMETTSRNSLNESTKFQKIGDILKKNRDTLQETLPEPQMNKVDEAIRDIDQTNFGRPRNDYSIDSRRGAYVGDEARSLRHPSELVAKVAGKLGGNYLKRNEMLTGDSSGDQIIQGLASSGSAGAQKALIANAVNEQNSLPDPVKQNEENVQQSSLPKIVSPQEIKQSAMSTVMNKYSRNQAVAPSPEDNESVEPPQPKQSAMSEVMKKYSSEAPKDDVAPPEQKAKALPFSQDEFKFLNKKLKEGDIESIIDFDNSYKSSSKIERNLLERLKQRESGGNYRAENSLGYTGAYQMGAQALEDVGLLKKGTSKDGNKALNNPNNWNIEGGKEAFLSDPSLQEQAAEKLAMLNKGRLMQMGVITPASTQEEINGYVTAAHLGGAGGAARLARGIDNRDAYGTSNSDYFRMGSRV